MFNWLSNLMEIVQFYQKDQEHLLDRIEALEREVQMLQHSHHLAKKREEDGK